MVAIVAAARTAGTASESAEDIGFDISTHGMTQMQRIATVVVVLAVLVLFAIVFGIAIVQVWQASTEPAVSESLLYFGTGLATVVGGAVAVAVNARPLAGAAPAGAAPAGGPAAPAGPLIVTGAVVNQLPNLINIVYVVVYAIIGITAIVTWVTHPAVTTSLVKNLATTFFALAIPTAGGFFKV
jgi:hypothetical protein